MTLMRGQPATTHLNGPSRRSHTESQTGVRVLWVVAGNRLLQVRHEWHGLMIDRWDGIGYSPHRIVPCNFCTSHDGLAIVGCTWATCTWIRLAVEGVGAY